MRQRWLVNLILLGIIAILALILIVEPGKEHAVTQPPLTTLTPQEVQNIRIEGPEQAPIQFQKDPQGHWQLTTPPALPANPFRLETLEQLVALRDYKPLDAEKLTLSAVQLDTPARHVYFNDQFSFAFGDTSAVNPNQRYVQLSHQKDKVYLITDNVYEFLTDEPLSFASLALLGPEPKITALQLPDYHLAQQQGRWLLTQNRLSGVDTRADALTQLIDNWRYARAIALQPYQAAATPPADISVGLAGQQQPIEFHIVAQAPEFILARADKGIQYQMPRQQVDELLHLPTAEQTATPSTAQPSKPLQY